MSKRRLSTAFAQPYIGQAQKKALTEAERIRISANRQAAYQKRLSSLNVGSVGFLGIEKKFYDTAFTGAITAPTDASGGELDPSATNMISTPTQGDGEQQRDGKQIAIDYLEIKGSVYNSNLEAQVNPPIGANAYIAIVLDTQTNGAQMNSEDCFKNLSGTALGATSPLRNLLWGKRFRILKSSVFDLTPETLTTAGANSFSWGAKAVNFHWFIPLKGLKVNFNSGTTASVANVIDNSIHVIGFANGIDTTPLITYNARIRFLG